MTYACVLCGSEELVEVSLVPRIYPLDPETGELDTMAEDEAFWESETVIGYGCRTDTCANWHGDFGIRVSLGVMRVDQAPTFEQVTGRSQP